MKKKELEGLLAEGKIVPVLNELVTFGADRREDIKHQALLLLSSYNREKQKHLLGTIGNSEMSVIENRITSGIIFLLSELEKSVNGSNTYSSVEHYLLEQGKSSGKDSFWTRFFLLIKRIFLGKKDKRSKLKELADLDNGMPLSHTSRKVEVFLNEEIADFSTERSKIIAKTLAEILEIRKEEILIRRVIEGSVIMGLEINYISSLLLTTVLEEQLLNGEQQRIFERLDITQLLSTHKPDDYSNSYNSLFELLEHFQESEDLNDFSLIYYHYDKLIVGKARCYTSGLNSIRLLVRNTFILLYLRIDEFRAQYKLDTFVLECFYQYLFFFTYSINNIKAEKLPSLSRENILNVRDEDIIPSITLLKSPQVFESNDENSFTLEDKTVLLMKYDDELSIREISQILNVTEVQVKLLVKRAKHRFLLHIRRFI